jgi:choline kinase
VKLIILAAGSGSRLKKIDSKPKPLIRIKNKPLIWWSLKSFHELITQGVLTRKDIKIVILNSQIENFLDCQEIKDFFGEINPFITMEKLTSGPGETGLIAVNKLIEDGLVLTTEKIIFSDADHFVWSPNIFRNLKVDSDIYLWQTKKDEDLDWCFVKTENGQIQLLEKPSKIENFDVSLGLIGIYGFKSVEMFITAANKIIHDEMKSSSDKETFMSSIVNMALRQNNLASLSLVKFFVPLGNPNQIEKATKLPDPDFFIFDSPTYFVDIDGVVFKHNYKKDLNSSENREIVLTSNAQTINDRYLDGLIIIVSARPEKQYNYMESTLKSSGINFDRLILGCTGGVRYLINDLKPGKEYTETAIAINTERDGVLTIEEPEISNLNLRGGSGAKTILIQQGTKFIVKKFATDNNDIDILKNQHSWYLHVQKLLGENAPTLKVLRQVENSNQYVLWTKYEQDLIGLYDWCSSINISNDEIKEVKTNLVHSKSLFGESEREVDLNLAIPLIEESFGELYSTSIIDHHHERSDVLPRIIKDKIFPSLDKTILRFAKSEDLMKILYDVRKQVDLFLNSKYLVRYSFQGAVACIHGDPTFSNLQVSTKKPRIIFTDPIGAAIEAGYDFSKFRAESFPVFDLARLELSYKYNYEFNQKLIQANKLSEDEIEAIVNFTFDHPSISQFLAKNIFLPFDTRNLDLVVATTMLRILKYKSDPDEIKLLALQARKILDSLL